MTVNYMRDAATVRLGTFLKLLFRWRGSVWKLIWKELILFLFIYFNLWYVWRFMFLTPHSLDYWYFSCTLQLYFAYEWTPVSLM